jgi:DNA-binding IclR family transcriptional regulator
MIHFMDKTNPPPSSEEDRYLVPGLMRGLQVLQAFTPEHRERSLGDIAAHLGVTKSAAFRAVYTLTHLGYLLHDARAGLYTLGPAVLRLGYGYLASRDLVEVALPELERLRDETDWSTHLGVRDGRSVLYLLRQPSRMGMSSIVHVGSRLPAAGTTLGRVLLADMEEADLRALFRDETWDRLPGRTPQSFADLLGQWHRDRGAGTVVQIDRFESGIASVAAPVRDLSGRTVAAISAARAGMGAEAAEALKEPVAATARRIAALLGAA